MTIGIIELLRVFLASKSFLNWTVSLYKEITLVLRKQSAAKLFCLIAM